MVQFLFDFVFSRPDTAAWSHWVDHDLSERIEKIHHSSIVDSIATGVQSTSVYSCTPRYMYFCSVAVSRAVPNLVADRCQIFKSYVKERDIAKLRFNVIILLSSRSFFASIYRFQGSI